MNGDLLARLINHDTSDSSQDIWAGCANGVPSAMGTTTCDQRDEQDIEAWSLNSAPDWPIKRQEKSRGMNRSGGERHPSRLSMDCAGFSRGWFLVTVCGNFRELFGRLLERGGASLPTARRLSGLHVLSAVGQFFVDRQKRGTLVVVPLSKRGHLPCCEVV